MIRELRNSVLDDGDPTFVGVRVVHLDHQEPFGVQSNVVSGEKGSSRCLTVEESSSRLSQMVRAQTNNDTWYESGFLDSRVSVRDTARFAVVLAFRWLVLLLREHGIDGSGHFRANLNTPLHEDGL